MDSTTSSPFEPGSYLAEEYARCLQGSEHIPSYDCFRMRSPSEMLALKDEGISTVLGFLVRKSQANSKLSQIEKFYILCILSFMHMDLSRDFSLVLDEIEDDKEVARWFRCLIEPNKQSVEFAEHFTQDDVDQLKNAVCNKSVIKPKIEDMTMTPEACRRAKEQEWIRWGNSGAPPAPAVREECDDSDDEEDGISDDDFWTLSKEECARKRAVFKAEKARRKRLAEDATKAWSWLNARKHRRGR
jgi:hypothetical protein